LYIIDTLVKAVTVNGHAFYLPIDKCKLSEFVCFQVTGWSYGERSLRWRAEAQKGVLSVSHLYIIISEVEKYVIYIHCMHFLHHGACTSVCHLFLCCHFSIMDCFLNIF